MYVALLNMFLGILFLLSFVFITLYKKYKIPWNTVPLLLGITAGVFIKNALIEDFLLILLNICAVFIVFNIGLRIDLNKLIKYSKVSFIYYFLSLLLYFIIFLLVFNDIAKAFLLSVIFSISSETIIYLVCKSSESKVLALEISIINSTLGALLFYLILNYLLSKSVILFIKHFFNFTMIFIILFSFIYILLRVFRNVFLIEIEKEEGILLIFSILFLFVALSEFSYMGSTIGAFLAGIILKSFILREKLLDHELKLISSYFFTPLFLFSIGFFANIFSINIFYILEFLLILLLVNLITSKIMFKNIKIGILLLSKMELDLVLLKTLYSYGFVTLSFYSSYIFATLILMLTLSFLFLKVNILDGIFDRRNT